MDDGTRGVVGVTLGRLLGLGRFGCWCRLAEFGTAFTPFFCKSGVKSVNLFEHFVAFRGNGGCQVLVKFEEGISQTFAKPTESIRSIKSTKISDFAKVILNQFVVFEGGLVTFAAPVVDFDRVNIA